MPHIILLTGYFVHGNLSLKSLVIKAFPNQSERDKTVENDVATMKFAILIWQVGHVKYVTVAEAEIQINVPRIYSLFGLPIIEKTESK
jgi:hypothetical protein